MTETGLFFADVSNANKTTDQLVPINGPLELPVRKKFDNLIIINRDVFAIDIQFTQLHPVTVGSVNVCVCSLA